MKPLVFAVLLCLVYFHSSAQNESIRWEAKKLTWSDFKAEPDNHSDFKALSTSGFGYAFNYSRDSMTVTTSTSFKPLTSWTKSTSDHLLAHEQLHFDITEYFRRVFLTKLSKTPISFGEIKSTIENLYAETRKELRFWQTAYDEETNHSLNKEQQEKWRTLINDKLKQSSEVSFFKALVR